MAGQYLRCFALTGGDRSIMKNVVGGMTLAWAGPAWHVCLRAAVRRAYLASSSFPVFSTCHTLESSEELYKTMPGPYHQELITLRRKGAGTRTDRPGHCGIQR